MTLARAVVVVQDLDVGVELLADPVSDECSYDAVLVLLGVVLDGAADVGERPTGLRSLDAEPHALLGHAHELAALGVDLADEEGGVRIAVHAADPAGDIDVADVAFAQRTASRGCRGR